jgi:hypothetical protein
MKTSPAIEAGIHDPNRLRLKRALSRAGPPSFGAAPGLWIEGLALGDERPEELRRRLEAAVEAHTPESPSALALVKQAVVAEIEIERLHRTRASLRAAAMRTALRDVQWAQENYVEELHLMFDGNSRGAIYGLKRSAAGVRFLIERWERLGRQLEQDSTWYGADRIEAIQLQGCSAMVDDLYLSEPAYWTWVWCLAAQPNPKERDIALVLDRRIMPKRLQDMDHPVWRPDAAESRARLQQLVTEALPPLRQLERTLRTRDEEPARAEAVQRALARFSKDEAPLLRELRSHEQSLAQAHNALAQRKSR